MSPPSAQCVVFSPQKLIGGLAPISVWRWKLHFPRYRLVKVSWKSVQPFPRTVVWYFCDGRKKQKKNKKQKKTYVKHIRICLISGCVNNCSAAIESHAFSVRLKHLGSISCAVMPAARNLTHLRAIMFFFSSFYLLSYLHFYSIIPEISLFLQSKLTTNYYWTRCVSWTHNASPTEMHWGALAAARAIPRTQLDELTALRRPPSWDWVKGRDGRRGMEEKRRKQKGVQENNNNNNNTLIYIAPACRMTSEALERVRVLRRRLKVWYENENEN